MLIYYGMRERIKRVQSRNVSITCDCDCFMASVYEVERKWDIQIFYQYIGTYIGTCNLSYLNYTAFNYRSI